MEFAWYSEFCNWLMKQMYIGTAEIGASTTDGVSTFVNQYLSLDYYMGIIN